jgi:hypothetical protein
LEAEGRIANHGDRKAGVFAVSTTEIPEETD